MHPWIINLQRINLWRLSMCLKIEITIHSDGRPTEIFVFSVKVVNSRFYKVTFGTLSFLKFLRLCYFPVMTWKKSINITWYPGLLPTPQIEKRVLGFMQRKH